jgi:polyisoprenyl-phosphate glycosyltransferase
MIGVLGEYIGKLLSEIKARPVYFVADHSVKSAEGAESVKPPAKPRAVPRAAE